MLDYTKDVVRLYSCRESEKLATIYYYWNALVRYLKDENKRFMLLVDSDNELERGHFQLLKKEKESRKDDSIQVKLVNSKDKEEVFYRLCEEHCSFGIYDDNKFKFISDIVENHYVASYGSFNRPSTCRKLIDIFDVVFNNQRCITLI